MPYVIHSGKRIAAAGLTVQFVGTIDLPSGLKMRSDGITGDSRYAYLAAVGTTNSFDCNLLIYDCLVKSSPSLVANLNLGDTNGFGIPSISVNGDVVVITGGKTAGYVYNTAVIDVSNRTSPSIKSTIDLAGNSFANQQFSTGGKNYFVAEVASGSNFGLKCYDITNTSSPSFASGFYNNPAGWNFDTIRVKGTTVFAMDASGGTCTLNFVAVDYSTPASPSQLGTFCAADSNDNDFGIGASGAGLNTLFCDFGPASGGFQLIDITTPASMSSLYSTTTNQDLAWGACVINNTIFGMDYATNTVMSYYDITTPSSPVLKGTANMLSCASGFMVSSWPVAPDRIYMEGGTSFQVVSVSGA